MDKPGVPKWIVVSTAVAGLIAATMFIAVRYFEMEKAKHEALVAQLKSEAAAQEVAKEKAREKAEAAKQKPADLAIQTVPVSAPVPPTVAAPVTPPTPAKPATPESLLIGRWERGNQTYEFFPGGKCTLSQTDKASAVKSYTVGAGGKIRITGANSKDWEDIISVTPDQLVLHTHIYHTIAADDDFSSTWHREKPPGPTPLWLEIVGWTCLAVVVVLLALLAIGLIQKAQNG